MLYMKNVPIRERVLRALGGAVIVGLGLYFYPRSLGGYGLALTGVFAALTGFVGFCPLCWLAGRKLTPKD